MSIKTGAVIYDKGRRNPKLNEAIRLLDHVNDYHGFFNNSNEHSSNIKYLSLNLGFDTRDQEASVSVNIETTESLTDYRIIRRTPNILGEPQDYSKLYDTVVELGEDSTFESAVHSLLGDLKIKTPEHYALCSARFVDIVMGVYCGSKVEYSDRVTLATRFGVPKDFAFTEVLLPKCGENKNIVSKVRSRVDKYCLSDFADQLTGVIFCGAEQSDNCCIMKFSESTNQFEVVFRGTIVSQRELSTVLSLVGLDAHWV